MPNTLAHLGVGGVVTRTLVPDADLKWICLGCVIPDVPWIVQRAVTGLSLGVDYYDLRLYAISEASLAGCLLLAGAFAMISKAPRKIFAVLALNSLVHLLLDACQTKWGDGVHLLAPVSWKPWNFGLFWPESITTYVLTFFGLVYFAFAWRRAGGTPVGLSLTAARRGGLAAILLVAYCLVPFVLRSGPERSDSHSVETLRESGVRAGRYAEFDRNQYMHREGGGALRTFAGEELTLTGVSLDRSAKVSIQGVFLDEKTLLVQQVHEHADGYREFTSLLGIALVALSWFSPRRERLERKVLRLPGGFQWLHIDPHLRPPILH